MKRVIETATRDTEGTCDTCGAPVYAGERVVLPNDPWDYRVWCTKECADREGVLS